jgi:threonine synthase
MVLNVEGVEVVILYPSCKVSSVQEKQLTTLGNNIHALEVEGNFDDCQQMVKAAFLDAELNKQLFLTSANSINVARWLPQQFYYFFAYKQWLQKDNPPVICVPSGNFGNICAGLLANASGLPVKHFIAATNANDVVPEFFKTENYQPKKAIATINNTMDVGDPVICEVLELFDQQFESLSNKVPAVFLIDYQTLLTVLAAHRIYATHMVQWPTGLWKVLKTNPGNKASFETAHPVKF